MPYIELAIGLLCLGFALLIHEYAHAQMSYQLGDPTAKYEGRLSLNPRVHFEPIGALSLTLTYILTSGGLIMGWAKPVPINSDNFKNRSLDMAIVALAGPFINFFIAFACSIVFLLGVFSGSLVQVFILKMLTANVGFGLFNLITWPPLDGWKIIAALVPEAVCEQMRRLEAKLGVWSLVVLLAIMWAGGSKLLYIANHWAVGFLTGGNF